MRDIDRRAFLGAAAGAALVVAGCSSSSSKKAAKTTTSGTTTTAGLGDPSKAPFDHIVVLMMENRSFDQLLGWLPGADGKQAGLTYPDANGQPQKTWAVGTDYQGCKYGDPPHQWQAGEAHLNGGKADGFLKTAKDLWPIGYYGKDAVPVTGALAQQYTTLDNYFPSLNAGTWPNRLYLHSAATDVDATGIMGGDPVDQVIPQSNLQLAIWDRLKDKGVSGKYYYVGEPITAIYKTRRYDDISVKYPEFLADAKAGTLPNVAFVEPDFRTVPELNGTSNDDHPHGDLHVGEGLIQEVYDALTASPQWDKTVFVLTWDEWGGFFDHVVPPKVTDNNVNPNPGPHPDYSQLGFRVPCIVAGPHAPKKIVSGGKPFEHCSITKMIEWRWGLKPMSARDQNARNLAEVLDFSKPRQAAQLPAFTAPTPTPCPTS
ncbi:MAG: alkaline phosphatase family protein [Acidimicrobiia bacterium]